jgi:hypothetical protein
MCCHVNLHQIDILWQCYFPFIAILTFSALSDIISINQLTLILRIIGQCDVKHRELSPSVTSNTENYRPVWRQTYYDVDNKNNSSSLKVSTYIITSIAASPIRLAALLAITSVLSFITAVILSVSQGQPNNIFCCYNSLSCKIY